MIGMKRLGLAIAFAGCLSTSAFAQASFTAKDASAVTQTFASFACRTSMICSMAVPADTTGAAFGVSANPFFMAFGSGVQLPGFASPPTVNLGTLNGAATQTTLAALLSAVGSPFQSGGSIGNTAFGISGTLPAFTSPPTVNLGTIGGAATQTTLAAILSALGTPFQAGASIGNTSFGISGTLPAFAAIPTFNLGTLNGAALATNQTGGNQKTQIVDGSGNVIASTSNNLNVQCANCSGSGVSTADNATFTPNISLFAGAGGIFQTTATSNPVTAGHQGLFQMTAQRAQFVNLRDSSGNELGTSTPLTVGVASGALASGAGTDGWDTTQGAKADAPCTLPATTTACSQVAIAKALANVANTPGTLSSQYPSGATAITASATGTTAATTATLAGAASKTTYICGYSIRANATANANVTNTLTGVITGTMSAIMWVPANTAGLGVDEQIFQPCIPASAQNTAIAAVSGAPGTGGLVSVKAWGYQQ